MKLKINGLTIRGSRASVIFAFNSLAPSLIKGTSADTRKCTNCKKIKSINKFYFAKKVRDKRHTACAECHKKYSINYAKARAKYNV